MDRYNKLNNYYKEKFGERVLKICVNAGFTCPNRDGSKGIGGCAFCSEGGSGEHIKYHNISEQIINHLNSYRGERANKFIVYFQAFTNTYASIEKLKEIYNSAFVSNKIIGISIATRPDCIDKEIVNLLCDIAKKHYVMVELGLQTADINIGQNLNLCYTKHDYVNAVTLLTNCNIDVVTHIMLGLPGETQDSIDETIDLINSYKISGIKIHELYVLKNTKLENLYNAKKYKPLTLDGYLSKLEYVITHIRPDIIIHRISGDAPKDLLIAPDWNTHKKLVLNGIDKLLRVHNTYQGIYYSSNN